MMEQVKLFYFLLLCSVCTGDVTLLLPNQVQSSQPLTAFYTVENDSPQPVTFTFTGGSSKLASYVERNIVGGGVLNSISLPSLIEPTTYEIEAKSEDFENTASFSVKVTEPVLAVFIQTDKPIYKPSQAVRIRVAAVDGDLLPKNETLACTVEDAEGVTIKQWKDKQLDMGLTELNFDLSDKPPLGDWTISCTVGEKMVTKTIKVDEYVPPRFEVDIGLPSYILSAASTIPISVSAIYTFGENVRGTVNVKISTRVTSVLRRGLDINGDLAFDLTSAEVSTLGLASVNEVLVEAEVTEPISGETLSGDGKTSVYQHDVVITFMAASSTVYRPGRPYTAYLKVSRPDGSPVDTEDMTLQASVQERWASEVYDTTSPLTVPHDGLVVVIFDSMTDIYNLLSLVAEVTRGEELYVMDPKDLDKFNVVNESNSLQIFADLTSVPQVGDDIYIGVFSSTIEGSFNYLVTAGGEVVDSGSPQHAEGGFSFKLSQACAPQTTVLVYAIINGELLADSITFNVDSIFQYEVDLEFRAGGSSVTRVEPGTLVQVAVRTEPGSRVGTLSVDKSITLLGSGNDITQSQIQTEFLSLVTSNDASCSSGEDSGPIFFWFPLPRFGGSSTEEMFSKASMTAFTTAEMSPCYGDIMWLRDGPMEAMVRKNSVAGAAPGDDSSDASSQPAAAESSRTFFPETWLWDLYSSPSSELLIETTVPDTITSWQTTAISMHPTKGLSVTASPTELTVKLDFFITPSLPYASVHGEELELRISVFNYGNADDVCTVTLAGSTDYKAKLLDVDDDQLYTLNEDLVAPPVNVRSSSGVPVSMWISPQTVGTIKIEASAQCNKGARDAFSRELLVKASGVPEEYCLTKYLQLSEGEADFTHQFQIDTPANITTMSKRVELSVTGDVMGPSIDGLDRLVKMPYGCGEQNMISFTPNIYVRQYLDDSGSLSSDIKALTTKYMESGYQRELTYKHTDGSFSAFGNSDPSGSTWLTAFVVRSFQQASDFIFVDSKVLDDAKSWLDRQVNSDGSLHEPGKVIHGDMQGGSSGPVTLAAYVLIARLEGLSGQLKDAQLSSSAKIISFLEGKLSEVADKPYPLAILTYALHLAGSPKAKDFLDQLEALSVTDGEMKYWQLAGGPVDPTIPSWQRKPGPSSVEMCAYALLTYVYLDEVLEARPIATWLTNNRASTGGFVGTQDTVLGLQALAGYAALVISDSTSLTAAFQSNTGLSFSHSITKENAIVTKRNVMTPADPITTVDVTVSGQGSTIISACVSYNLAESSPKKTVNVSAKTEKINGSATVDVEVCAVYTGQGESGMGLITVGMATGYSALGIDYIKKLSGEVSLIEVDVDGSIQIYLNELNSRPSCIRVPLVRDMQVKGVQDAWVRASQYYRAELGNQAPYNPDTYVVVEPTRPPTPSAAVSLSASVSLGISLLFFFALHN